MILEKPLIYLTLIFGIKYEGLRCLLVAAGHDAAVHIPNGPGDPGGLIRQEEIDDRGHVIHSPHPADGVEGVKAGQGFLNLIGLDEFAVYGGDHHGRGDGIDPNVIIGQLHGKMLGQGMQAGLGHGVSR
jgi:hypothetical protein